jgi:hypothetical protein
MVQLSRDVSSTPIDEDVTQNMTWTSVGNPWIIQRSIAVHNEAVLSLQPGVIIKINGPFTIDCFGSGRIEAIGLDDDRIEFDSNSPVTYNYTYITTGVGGIFKNCTFSAGNTTLKAYSFAVIEGSNFTDSLIGLLVWGNDVTITECVFVNCEIGIQVLDSSRTIITGCEVSVGIRGIYIIGISDHTTVDNCYAHNLNIRGIEFKTSGLGNRVMNCTVRWIDMGVLVWFSRDVLIYRVNASYCQSGIGVADSSSNELLPIRIQRCRLTDNLKGIWLSGTQWTIINETTLERNQAGICDLFALGSGIVFWRNNFLWNKAQVDLEYTTINWSANGEGNYWSNYGGVDDDGDGIGDTPHNIRTIGQDPFPLMKPVDFENPFADAGEDVIVRQHGSFILDGNASTDDTWIANWTWIIQIPGDDIVLYGPEPSGVIDIHGNFTAILQVTDPVGKIAEDSISIVVTDGDPPWLLDVVVPGSVFTGDILNVSCTIQDNAEMGTVMFEYMFGSGPVRRLDLNNLGGGMWTKDLQVPLDLNADIYYTLIARDQRGNVNTTEFLSIRVLDNIPPEFQSDLPDNVTTGEDATLMCIITDNIKVNGSSVEWWYPGISHQTSDLTRDGNTWAFLITIPSNATSPLSVRFASDDQARNFATSSTWEIIVIDNDPPSMVTFFTIPHHNQFHKGELVEFSVEFKDNIGIDWVQVELHYYGTEWEQVNIIPSAGIHHGVIEVATDMGNRLWFRFNASDPTGNVITTNEMQVELLSQNPQILTDPVVQVLEDEEYNLAMTVEDPDNDPVELVWLLETNASWLRLEESVLIGIPADEDVGWYFVNISIIDGDGGEAWLLFNLTVIDVNHPPTIEIRFPEDGVRAGSILRVSGSTVDDGNEVKWVRYQVDTGEWIEAEGTAQWNFDVNTKDLVPGTHHINVKTYDGISESDVQSVSFKVPEPESEGISSEQVIGMIGIAAVVLAVGAVIYFRRK